MCIVFTNLEDNGKDTKRDTTWRPRFLCEEKQKRSFTRKSSEKRANE